MIKVPHTLSFVELSMDRETCADLEKEVDQIPRTVWVLGVVSFFMNSASIIITALTPYFIMSVLGSSVAAVGYIRGTTEALSYIVKLFSGVISDYIGKRKPLILIGYGCAILTKPMFGMAKTVYQYVAAQIIERVANGLRDTPRDALIADCVPKKLKGASYGIRQSFAFAGSMVGSLACYFLLSYFSVSGNMVQTVRMTYFIAMIPSLLAFALLFWGISEPDGKINKLKDRKGFPIKKEDIHQLGGRFWYFIFVILVFMICRFSDAFLTLRAQELGWGVTHVSLVLMIMYLANSITAKLVGTWSDKIDRRVFLAAGFVLMSISCVVLGMANNIATLLVGVVIYGLHYGATQGTFFALVADYSPQHIKGTSFGVFNFVCAIGMFLSNSLTGRIWNNYGAETALYIMAFVAAISATLAVFLRKPKY